MRCSDCKVCHSLSGCGQPGPVFWCLVVEAFRCSVSQRSCPYFIAMSVADYMERAANEKAHRQELVGVAAVLHIRKWSAADYRVSAD